MESCLNGILTYRKSHPLQSEFWPTRNFDLRRYHCSQCYSESVFRELLTTIAAKILYDPKWPHDVDELYLVF